VGRLAVKRVECAAEASRAATAAAIRERAALITARKLVPLPPAPLPDKPYAAVDGTGIPVTARETAGPAGKGEDGRARTREVKLDVFFAHDKLDEHGYPVRGRGPESHAATFEPAATFGDLARRLEFMLGDRKEEWLAARLEDLDYSDVEGICKAARIYPLEGVKKDETDIALGYFENNAPRMRYHWFRQCGLFLGSGPVEAGCKSVIGHRLKRAGMHWTVNGAAAIAASAASRPAGQVWTARRNQIPAA
jgi:hypothetical protein